MTDTATTIITSSEMKMKALIVAALIAATPALALGKEKKVDIQENLLNACKSKISDHIARRGKGQPELVTMIGSPDSLIFTAMKLGSSTLEDDKERLKRFRARVKKDGIEHAYLNGDYAFLTMSGSSRVVGAYSCYWRSDFAGITDIREGNFLLAN